jgi:aspartate aminotransferase-like enzyme
MNALHTEIDADGLMEFSVVFTDRSLNSMSAKFQKVMRDISGTLKEVYNGDGVAIVPGGGTFAMEAVARQFGTGKNVMIIRNGWFSYRWTQIFEMGDIPAKTSVKMAQRAMDNIDAPFQPMPIDELVAAINNEKPDVVFAPHVETSAGVILPDDYLKSIGEAVRSYGGLFVLDCIASGCIWVDMKACNVDVLISAPQKGWSSSPAAGLVILGERAIGHLPQTTSTSFSCDLKKWFDIMKAYENGGHAYHATMPTDALVRFRDIMFETKSYGFEAVKAQQWELGNRARKLIEGMGFKSVASEGFKAPGVVVSYTQDSDIQNGKKFLAEGMQIAAGVPLQVNEGADFKTFRIGLFGLDKLQNIDATLDRLKGVFSKVA